MSDAPKATPKVSGAQRAAELTPDVRALELANQRAQFESLNVEWNSLYKHTNTARKALEMTWLYGVWLGLDAALGAKAAELKACGLRVSDLERASRSDEYSSGHVKVGT